jgi:hypothetical protein
VGGAGGGSEWAKPWGDGEMGKADGDSRSSWERMFRIFAIAKVRKDGGRIDVSCPCQSASPPSQVKTHA